MAEEQELSPTPVLPRKHQFSLATLFIIPIVLLPLFFSGREVYNVITNRSRAWGIEIIVLGLVYPLFFVLLSVFRRPKEARFGRGGPVLWAGIRGGLFGLLYFSLLFFPVAISELLCSVYARQDWWSKAIYLAEISAGVVVVGVVFGGAVGSSVGLILSLFLPRYAKQAEE